MGWFVVGQPIVHWPTVAEDGEGGMGYDLMLVENFR